MSNDLTSSWEYPFAKKIEALEKHIEELKKVIEDILSRSQDIEVIASEALSEGGADE